MTKAASFQQPDLTRALKSVLASGMNVVKIEIGSIVVYAGRTAESLQGIGASPEKNPCDVLFEPNPWDDEFKD